MSATHDRFVEELNDLLDKLVDDGCFDHAQILAQILEDHDLLREVDAYSLDEYDGVTAEED
jgi:hypothetical protein